MYRVSDQYAGAAYDKLLVKDKSAIVTELSFTEVKNRDCMSVNATGRWTRSEYTLDEALPIFFKGLDQKNFHAIREEAYAKDYSFSEPVEELIGILLPEGVYRQFFYNNLTKFCNFLSMKDNDAEGRVSYLLKTDYRRALDPWRAKHRKNRPLISIIREVFALAGDPLSDEFVHEMAIRFKRRYFNDDLVFEWVKGKDIAKYYSEHTYDFDVDMHDLRNSCMRYQRCQDYDYFDLYTENSNIEMLVGHYKESPKICTRTIVWTTSDGSKIHDRIYGSLPSQRTMADYLTSQGVDTWVRGEGQVPKYTELEEAVFGAYPYVDTMCYLDVTNKRIGNFEWAKLQPVDNLIQLQHQEGRFIAPDRNYWGQ